MQAAPTTKQEAHQQWSSKVYQDLTYKYLDSEWASLTLPTDSCLTDIKTAIFSVDLDAFTALCSPLADCDFDAANYVPYAWGFLFTEDSAQNCFKSGRWVRAFFKPDTTQITNVMLYWSIMENFKVLSLYNCSFDGSNWSWSLYRQSTEGHGALDSSFDTYNSNPTEGKGLIFSLLKSTTGLEKGTSLSAYSSKVSQVLGEKTTFNLGWNVFTTPVDYPTPVEPVEPPTVKPKEQKWYQKKKFVISTSFAASFATIAILMLLW